MGNPGARLAAYYDMRDAEKAITAAAKHGPLQSLTDRELDLREQPVTIYPYNAQRRVRVWVRFGAKETRVTAKLVRATPAAAGVEFTAEGTTYRCWVWGNAVSTVDE